MRNRSLLKALFICSCLQCVLPQHTRPCPGFVQEPPATVVVAEDGTRTIVCEHTNALAGLNWYREGTIIQTSQEEVDRGDACDCSTVGELLPNGNARLTMTFRNFREETAGEYGCWLGSGGIFDQCDFDVTLATPPFIMPLSTNDVSGAQIDGTLTISPTIDSGMPAANITWRHYGRELDPVTESRVSILADGTLQVSGIRAVDRGVYTLQASNTAGSVEESVNVVIPFLEQDMPTFQTVGSDYILTCRASGYPSPVQVTWDPVLGGNTPSVNSNMGDFDSNVTSVYRLPRAECVDSDQVFTCTATAAGRSATGGVTPCDAPEPPTNVRVGEITAVSVALSWSEPPLPAAGYKIRYYVPGELANSQLSDFIMRGTSSFTVTGLEPSTTYMFEVGSVSSEQSNSPVYAAAVEATTEECAAPELTASVSNVNAALTSAPNTQRTIMISWNASNEEGVVQYKLTIMPDPAPNSDPESSFVRMTSTSLTEYTLPSDSCNGRTYQFVVEPLNMCSSPGPRQTVSLSCSTGSINPVSVTIPSRSSTALQLSVTAQNPAIDQLNITATTLGFNGEGNIVTNTYMTREFALDSVCIGGLQTATFYNVCVTTIPTGGGMRNVACIQDSTRAASDASGNDLTGCLVPENVISNEVEATTAFPDWAIAVIVVGVLAVIAIIFCFIGLCFACNTSNSKDDYDMGSVSSLQTASIPAGPGVPPYLPNHRNTSPQRSCLSYNKNGHRLNWNEHRDTLRQMDTDSGTHV